MCPCPAPLRAAAPVAMVEATPPSLDAKARAAVTFRVPRPPYKRGGPSPSCRIHQPSWGFLPIFYSAAGREEEKGEEEKEEGKRTRSAAPSLTRRGAGAAKDRDTGDRPREPRWDTDAEGEAEQGCHRAKNTDAARHLRRADHVFIVDPS